LFEFIHDHRELMRIAFATAFAARGEIPAEIEYMKKCNRNFEFIHALIKKARTARLIDSRFSSRELAMGIYGMMSIRIMEHLVQARRRLTRDDAQSIVKLYLGGAARRKS
jgi:hypothetical protein